LVGGKVYRSAGSEPIGDGIILIRNGRVAVVGGRASVRVPPEARVIDCRGLVVVPGFWNSHVHFTEEHWSGAATAPAARLSRQLREMLLRYGFVHVVDTGSWLENTLALRRRIERGEVVGPAILTTGPGFVPPGASPFYIRPAKLPELASPQEAGPAVGARLDQGADAIKLFTGSMASPTQVAVMPLEIVKAATGEAHRRGRPVLAHPSNNAGLESALDGGVDILAHTTPDDGPWDSSFVSRMKRARMALIPTLQLWKFELSRRGADSATTERFMSVAIEQLRLYSTAGGEVLFGTDVGYMTHYDPADEYRYMQRASMSFPEILAALTTTPGRRFEPAETTIGTIEPGADADVVALEGDPEQSIAALARPRYVLRSGRLVYPGRTP